MDLDEVVDIILGNVSTPEWLEVLKVYDGDVTEWQLWDKYDCRPICWVELKNGEYTIIT